MEIVRQKLNGTKIRELAQSFTQLKFAYEAEKNKTRQNEQQKKDERNKRFRDAYLCRNRIFHRRKQANGLLHH